jgi:hypothetical protein
LFCCHFACCWLLPLSYIHQPIWACVYH